MGTESEGCEPVPGPETPESPEICEAAEIPEPREVIIENIPPTPDGGEAVGVYDPSVVSADGVHWLTFSRVRMVPEGIPRSLVDVMLARRDGDRWVYVATLVEGTVTPRGADGLIDDVLALNETASIVYDPEDTDPARRWKLYWLRGYFEKQPIRWTLQCHVISMKAAASPAGLAEAPESALFELEDSSTLEDPWSTLCDATYDINEVRGDSVVDIVGFGEPSVTAGPNGLTMVLHGATGGFAYNELFTITSTDRNSWEYEATQLTQADAESFGYFLFSAGELAEIDDANGERKRYLLTSPLVETEGILLRASYRGVFAFELQDGVIRRDEAGLPIVSRYIPALYDDGVGGGQSTYDPDVPAEIGMLMAQAVPGRDPTFWIFELGQPPMPAVHAYAPLAGYVGPGDGDAAEASCEGFTIALDSDSDVAGQSVALSMSVIGVVNDLTFSLNDEPFDVSVAPDGTTCVIVDADQMRVGFDLLEVRPAYADTDFAVGELTITPNGECL
jgi:hypothetical protein